MMVKLIDDHGNDRVVEICDTDTKVRVSNYIRRCKGCGKSLLIDNFDCPPKTSKVGGYFNIYAGSNKAVAAAGDFILIGPRSERGKAQEQASEGCLAAGVLLSFEIKEEY